MVSNAGDYDKTEVYFYDGQWIVQTNNGSGTMVQQFIHGTQYIDELVMMRVKDKGDLYVHQDANWNVIGTTDLGRHVVERNVYTPYGELTVHQDTGFGDRDGDQDVDSTDKGTVGTTCTGTVSGSCRILDLDFDGDYDSADATKFDALTQGAMRHPGRPATSVSQPFAHQGLPYEPELAQYQNRARQYDPGKRRFVQRDPLEFRSGLNLYGYGAQNPHLFTDPSGAILGTSNCSGAVGMINSALPPGASGFECTCPGHTIRRKAGGTPCPLCDELENLINDPNRVYNIHDTPGPANKPECATGYCNEPGPNNTRDIFIDPKQLKKLPNAPPAPPRKHGTTRGEIFAHELAEARCIAGGGHPDMCHANAALTAQNSVRQGVGQAIPAGVNSTGTCWDGSPGCLIMPHPGGQTQQKPNPPGTVQHIP